jgi:cell division protein FtsI/penicillin-binding protein 2
VASRNRALAARLILLGALFLGCACLLTYRLYTYQYLEHERYRRIANDEHRDTITVPARRGSLLDANGNPLAVTVNYSGVEIVGKEVRNPQATAQSLGHLLDLDLAEILGKIDPASDRPVLIKDRLPAAVADRVEELGLRGVHLADLPTRQYPEGSIAAQVLGFVGRDNNGLTGLEMYFDGDLAGRPGTIDTERDTVGQEIILARRVVSPPRDGADIVLTLDRFVQRTIERELADAVRKNKAVGGMILVMEPATGAILGMASWPTYTLDGSLQFKPEEEHLYKAVAVTNQYEPGSVMKVITMAAGLDKGVVTPNATVNDTGVAHYGSATIHNWNKAANGVISMTQVLVRSSNIGAQFVANRVGKEGFYQYLSGFGFGEPTGVELPGEVPGALRTHTSPGWAPVDLATNSFGQGIAVTPLQMLTAIAAIGNDGVLLRPTLVREIVVDGQVHRPEPHAVRRVISVETARTLRDMLVTVLEQTALQPYRIPGYRNAGKTGTADMPTNLGYTSGKTFASIVSLLPADRPRLAVLIRIDAPEAIYGGVVAAPVLQRVGQQLLEYYRIPAATAEPAGNR